MFILLWLAQYNKALVAFTMSLIYFFNARYGVEIPLDEETVGILWAAISGFATWLIPNIKPAKEEDNVEIDPELP